MTRLLLAAALLAAVAWLWRRLPAKRTAPPARQADAPGLVVGRDAHERYGDALIWSEWCPDQCVHAAPDPMDGVQWDPWTREVRESVEHVLHPSLHRWLVPDPTYLEATALAAIRRSAQSADVTTEGTS